MFCCCGNTGRGAADLSRLRPLNQGKFEAPRVPGGLDLPQSGERPASEDVHDAEEARGGSGWLVITDSRPQTSERPGDPSRPR